MKNTEKLHHAYNAYVRENYGEKPKLFVVGVKFYNDLLKEYYGKENRPFEAELTEFGPRFRGVQVIETHRYQGVRVYGGKVVEL